MLQVAGVLPRHRQYDCIVAGGGPAGATAGAILAREGYKVLIAERECFPRHHIGESLMPQTYWTFKRLGVLEWLQKSSFPRKESVQFVGPTGRDSEPYFFSDRDNGEWSTTWQVPRDCFDHMMLNNARRCGAETCQGIGVKRVLFDGNRACGVELAAGSRRLEVASRIVIDATGQNALIGRQLKLVSSDPNLRNSSIYAYYKGAYRDPGRNSGATIIIHTRDRTGWFWYIPLNNDLTSVGLVAPPEMLFAGNGDPLDVFLSEVDNCPGIKRRIGNATRTDDVRVLKDYTYCAREVAGDGWVLAGDAFGFLDPVYSSGVFLALKSAEMAADCVNLALKKDDCSAATLGIYGDELKRGMFLLGQLVYSFYDRDFSVGKFLASHPECEDHLVRLLIGDVFNSEVGEIFQKMKRWTDASQPSTGNGRSTTTCDA